MPQLHTGELLQQPLFFPENKNKHWRQIDYIFILSGNAETRIGGKETGIYKAIKKYYEVVFISPDYRIELYRSKTSI